MNYSRKKKWINPELQLGLLVLIGAAAIVSVTVQAVVLARALGLLAESLPNDAALVSYQLPELIVRASVGTLMLLFPTLYFLGVGLTFRIFGPLYRFRAFIKGVLAGDQVEECRLREGDRLQDLCLLLNQATADRRRENGLKQAQAHPARAAGSAAVSGSGSERAA
jgi:hypothetical protein